MKNIFKIFLLLIIPLSLTACFSNNSNTNNETNTSKKEQTEVIPLNQTYKNDKYEITIKNYEWVNKIEPTNPGKYYNSYTPYKDSTFIKINATIKNLGSDAVNIDSIAYQISINDKYNYKLQTVIDRNGDLSGLPTVKPLETVDAIIFTSIPNEAKNNMKSIRLYCGYNNGYDNQFDTFDSKDNKIEFLLK